MPTSPFTPRRCPSAATRSRARGAPRVAALVAVLLSVALVSGCASGGPKVASVTSSSSAGATTSTSSSSSNPALASTGHRVNGKGAIMNAAFAYATCLRSNGLSNYPDPKEEHQGLIISVPLPNTGSGLPLDAPQVVKAAQACARQRAAVFGPPSAAELAEIRARAEKTASCMHAHGFSGYPSPVVNGQGAETLNVPSSVLHQPGFRKAFIACQASADASSS